MVLASDVHHAGSPHTGVHEGGRAALHSTTPRLQAIHKEAQVKIYTQMYVMCEHTHGHDETIVIYCANIHTSLPATAPAPAPAPAPAHAHSHAHAHAPAPAPASATAPAHKH